LDCSEANAARPPAPAAPDARPPAAAATEGLPLRDPARLGALLVGLEPRLAAVALRYTRDPDAARDVVQNAFEKVLRHGQTFRGQARLSTWLHRIVANEALMWLRAQRRRRDAVPASGGAELQAAVDGAATPFESLALRQQLERLRASLRSLPREERDVVRCCALGGLSYGEFAARFGVHPAAVKSRAFRARRRLAGMLRK